MYCRNCGAQIPDNAKFCTNCGADQNNQSNHNNQSMQNQQGYQQQANYNNQNLVGFSSRISDPAYSKFIGRSKRGAKMVALFILIILPLGFGIAGSVSDEIDNPEAILMGLAMGFAYYIFSIIWTKVHFSSKSWDGVVSDKKIKKRRHNHDDYGSSYATYKEYIVYFRGNNGQKHKLVTKNSRKFFDYYNIGDRIRFHGGLNSIEKYDKSRDSIIYCNACGTENNINSDCCSRCKVPLLK